MLDACVVGVMLDGQVQGAQLDDPPLHPANTLQAQQLVRVIAELLTLEGVLDVCEDVGLGHTMIYFPVVFNTDISDGTAMAGMGYRMAIEEQFK